VWARATDGDTRSLTTGAGAEAVAQLLSPPGIVFRGPELVKVRPLRVRAIPVPPEVTLEVEVRAYLGVPELDDGIRRKRKLWWRLAAEDSVELPWRVVDAKVDPFRP
jgi:hypothetical protein